MTSYRINMIMIMPQTALKEKTLENITNINDKVPWLGP
jgi:hypothetical protein